MYRCVYRTAMCVSEHEYIFYMKMFYTIFHTGKFTFINDITCGSNDKEISKS